VFAECEYEVDFAYLEALTFRYAGFDLSANASLKSKHKQMAGMDARLNKAILEAMADTPDH
jgi:hypothetical protein